MKAKLVLAAGFTAALLLGSPLKAEPKAVVELFTSQGCSSCPPADAFLGDLAGRDEIIALSFNVDYWDYLGWKDTLGRPENTQRQYNYAASRGDRRVYTPQMVINGADHYVGSARSRVERAIADQALSVPVEVTRVDDALEITIGGADWNPDHHTTVRLVTFDPRKSVQIDRGENTGRTITYHNVVRTMQPVGMWKGKPMTISLPIDEVMASDAGGCAVIVQADGNGGPGEIVGAAIWQRPGS